MDVEAAYLEEMRRIGFEGRAARTASLFHLGRMLVQERILQEHPNLSGLELNIRIAEQLYAEDARSVEFIRNYRLEHGLA